MTELLLAKLIKNQYDTLPQGWAFYALCSEGTYLYSGYTGSLKQRLNFMQNKADEGGLYEELWAQADKLVYATFPNSMEALLASKIFLAENSPEYQHRLSPYSEYAYLALDARRFPFISIQEHTNDDWLYIGPFRSRFFLADVIDTVSRILKLPACDTGNYPCEKFDRDICRGWCLSLAPSEESKNEHDLDKLELLLKEAFVHPVNGILELVQQEKDKYYSELEFEKASLLDDEIDLLERYRNWLNFLYVAKTLELDTDDLLIQKGKIRFCKHQGKEYYFPVDGTEFRENELLALNLDSVDESRVVYDYITKKKQTG